MLLLFKDRNRTEIIYLFRPSTINLLEKYDCDFILDTKAINYFDRWTNNYKTVRFSLWRAFQGILTWRVLCEALQTEDPDRRPQTLVIPTFKPNSKFIHKLQWKLRSSTWRIDDNLPDKGLSKGISYQSFEQHLRNPFDK